ncbi:hypothetical protein N7488_004393 [Penicillium malachiteum]|nr:hypothetical protein N7488_004393 [Penicillium malachiteum]
MVLDNADDDGPLVNFLPDAAHGSILITSRKGLAARNLVGSRMPFTQSGESGEDKRTLVEILEYIPLAITQAASCIMNRSPRVTLFRESNMKTPKIFGGTPVSDMRLLRHGSYPLSKSAGSSRRRRTYLR